MTTAAGAPARGPASEVFRRFLRLGLCSFGGSLAHLGYFRSEFVERRRWLDDRALADLVALCQFLPGPASGQVGIALVLLRAGWRGAFAAWRGFTLPSAVLLVGFGLLLRGSGSSQGAAWLHGLEVVAIAVVALPPWRRACGHPFMQRALSGINASVAGVLLAAFVDPVWIMAVHGAADLLLAAAALAQLVPVRAPPWAIVAACAAVAMMPG